MDFEKFGPLYGFLSGELVERLHHRDEFIRYRIAVCDAKSKFCDAKLNVIRRKLRCKAILTAQK